MLKNNVNKHPIIDATKDLTTIKLFAKVVNLYIIIHI